MYRYIVLKPIKTRQDTKRFPAAGQPELRGPVTAYASMISLRFVEQVSVMIINTHDQTQKLTNILRIDGTQGRRVVLPATGLGSQKKRASILKGDNLDIPANTKSGVDGQRASTEVERRAYREGKYVCGSQTMAPRRDIT